VILYEYPFNERLRTYLRLEQLFRRLGELIPRSHALDHHFALVTIFEIMDVAARADLKSDVLKDIEKHKHQLDSYRATPRSPKRRWMPSLPNWTAASPRSTPSPASRATRSRKMTG
jgi:cell division FtsZ-interacting protein ZapD